MVCLHYIEGIKWKGGLTTWIKASLQHPFQTSSFVSLALSFFSFFLHSCTDYYYFFISLLFFSNAIYYRSKQVEIS